MLMKTSGEVEEEGVIAANDEVCAVVEYRRASTNKIMS